jgi:hypothetical protein
VSSAYTAPPIETLHLNNKGLCLEADILGNHTLVGGARQRRGPGALGLGIFKRGEEKKRHHTNRMLLQIRHRRRAGSSLALT